MFSIGRVQLTLARSVPSLPLPDSAQLGAVPPGSAGTLAVLRMMAGIARQSAKLPLIRSLAIQITNGLPNKSYTAEVQAVQQWVRRNVRYVRDVEGVETLTLPQYTIAQRAGDCDDHSMLVAALLLAIGHRCRYVAVGRTLETLQHVFTETLVGRDWVAVETTEPWPLGRVPNPRAYPARMVQSV
ncbi:MAG TPA: transglutaminase-like domain-containing protein [Reyranellaceae bacterium]|nr:transglutaminase-like domain-containing protein [Reyranellaceae bacterium]